LRRIGYAESSKSTQEPPRLYAPPLGRYGHRSAFALALSLRSFPLFESLLSLPRDRARWAIFLATALVQSFAFMARLKYLVLFWFLTLDLIANRTFSRAQPGDLAFHRMSVSNKNTS